MGRLLWTPPPDVHERTPMGRFLNRVEETRRRNFDDYLDLWQWSVDDLPAFWSAVWDYFDVPHTGSREWVLSDSSMPFTRWFPFVQLNFAEAMLRLSGRSDDDVIIHARSDTRPDTSMTVAQLRSRVSQVRAGLVQMGVGRGDRVAAYMPNIPETLILLLATASLGAIFTSCPPEFGARNVIDRWSQIDPSLVVAVDGYRFGRKPIDRMDDVEAIVDALGLQDRLVVLPYLSPDRAIREPSLAWTTLESGQGPLEFEQVDFDHPLWILFTSGTTGPPKAIVHGHGGIALEFSKLHGLHHGLGPADAFFWFSTTGWVMWNFLVTGLLVGTNIVLYDGDPSNNGLGRLWDIAGDFGVTYLGLSAPFVMECRRNGVVPRSLADLSRVREIGSTGSALPDDGFDWLFEQFGPGIRINSTSGGTDVATAFVGGSPFLPVRSGEISGRHLGCRVEAWGPNGKPVTDEVGEMVITAPMPSMPIGFWNDATGDRYRRAYFDTWPGVWRHGDWITIGIDGHCVIHGRSDATLNRGGVRLGTAEFYRVVENLGSVADSLVVHIESSQGGAGELILFLAARSDRRIDDTVMADVRSALRSQLSPRHVPDVIYVVPSIPKTLSGKKLEVPVKRVLLGAAPAEVADLGALSDPRSLDVFTTFRRAAPRP